MVIFNSNQKKENTNTSIHAKKRHIMCVGLNRIFQ